MSDEVERAPHGNLKMCHGAGLAYQGTRESDMTTAAIIIPLITFVCLYNTFSVHKFTLQHFK